MKLLWYLSISAGENCWKIGKNFEEMQPFSLLKAETPKTSTAILPSFHAASCQGGYFQSGPPRALTCSPRPAHLHRAYHRHQFILQNLCQALRPLWEPLPPVPSSYAKEGSEKAHSSQVPHMDYL